MSEEESEGSPPRPVRRKIRSVVLMSSASESDSDESIAAVSTRRKRLRVMSDDGASSSGSSVVLAAGRRRTLPALRDSDADSDTSGWATDHSDAVPPADAPPDAKPTSGFASDSSEGNSDKCSICLLRFKDQEVGIPENCEHIFCLDCITEWSKNVNTCPVDRITFNTIVVRACAGGRVLRTDPVVVQRRSSVDVLVVEDPTACEICGNTDSEETMLLCDSCDLGYHMHCLTPPLTRVPIDRWLCPYCQDFMDMEQLDELDDLFSDIAGMEFPLGPRPVPLREPRNVRRSGRNRGTGEPSTSSLNSNTETAPSTSRGTRAPRTSRTGNSRATTRRRTTGTHRRKYKRRRAKTVIIEYEVESGGKFPIKKTVRRKLKRKVRKRQPRTAARRSHVRASVRAQLAGLLHAGDAPAAGHAALTASRQRAGIPSLSLFGNPAGELEYFSEEEHGVSEGATAAVARRPTPSILNTYRQARRKMISIPSPPHASAAPDILSGILESQTLLHSKKSIVSISVDGQVDIKLRETQKRSLKEGDVPVKEAGGGMGGRQAAGGRGGPRAGGGGWGGGYRGRVPPAAPHHYAPPAPAPAPAPHEPFPRRDRYDNTDDYAHRGPPQYSLDEPYDRRRPENNRNFPRRDRDGYGDGPEQSRYGPPEQNRFGNGPPDANRFGNGPPEQNRFVNGPPDANRFGNGPPEQNRFGNGPPEQNRFGGPPEQNRFGNGPPEPNRFGPPEPNRFGPPEQNRFGNCPPEQNRFGNGPPEQNRFGNGPPEHNRFGNIPPEQNRFGNGPPEHSRFGNGPPEQNRFGNHPEPNRFGNGPPEHNRGPQSWRAYGTPEPRRLDPPPGPARHSFGFENPLDMRTAPTQPAGLRDFTPLPEPPQPPFMQRQETDKSEDEENENSELVIDTDKYDPTEPTNDEDSPDETPAPMAAPLAAPVVSQVSSLLAGLEGGIQVSAGVLQSAVRQALEEHRGMMTAGSDDDDDGDCPNFAIYSATSVHIASDVASESIPERPPLPSGDEDLVQRGDTPPAPPETPKTREDEYNAKVSKRCPITINPRNPIKIKLNTPSLIKRQVSLYDEEEVAEETEKAEEGGEKEASPLPRDSSPNEKSPEKPADSPIEDTIVPDSTKDLEDKEKEDEDDVEMDRDMTPDLEDEPATPEVQDEATPATESSIPEDRGKDDDRDKDTEDGDGDSEDGDDEPHAEDEGSDNEPELAFSKDAKADADDVIEKMTESISETEDERSYTPCLDENKSKDTSLETEKEKGIEGLDTEMISEEEGNEMFSDEEKPPSEPAAGDDDGKRKKKKDSKSKDKKTKTKKGDIAFKKLSKSGKERNYRDKDKKKERRDSADAAERKQRRKEKRKDLERYDVRTVVTEKRKRVKDAFGRDVSPRRSASSPRDGSPRSPRSPRRRRTVSSRRRSLTPRRTSITPRRRSITPRRKSISPRRKSISPRRRSISPRRKSISPRRKSISPRRRSISLRRKSISPRRKSISPRRKSISPRRRSISPLRRRSISPLRRRSISPLRRKSISPLRRKSISPRRKSISPLRRKSISPRRKSISPRRRSGSRVRKGIGRARKRRRSTSRSPKPVKTKKKKRARSERPSPRRKVSKLGKRKRKRVGSPAAAAAPPPAWSPPPAPPSPRTPPPAPAPRHHRGRRVRDTALGPCKEVFTSGDNILVSVSFKDHERDRDAGDKRKRRDARRDKRRKRRRAAAGAEAGAMKPVAIIDLERSPFRELTPSPKNVIVLSDSDHGEAPPAPEPAPHAPVGPKTPPSPGEAFNPPAAKKPVSTEKDRQPVRQGAEARASPAPQSPDAYDPFEPTRSPSPTPSRTPSPEPAPPHPAALAPPQPSPRHITLEGAQRTNMSADDVIDRRPVEPIEKVMALLQSTRDVSPEPPPGDPGSIQPDPAPEPGPAPATTLPTPAVTPAVAPPTQVPPRIVLPSPTRSQPPKLFLAKPSPIKSNPVKPMQATKISRLPLPAPRMDADDSPYSPGSSDFGDLFDPPGGQPARPGKRDNFDSLFDKPSKRKNKSSAAKVPVKFNRKKGNKTQVGVKIDEDNLKILDDLPSSAVEMQVKSKFLKKLNRQERVVEEVKLVLKPHYNKKRVTKDEYKDVLRRAVPKICHNKSGEINPTKIQALVEAYVKKIRKKHKLGLA